MNKIEILSYTELPLTTIGTNASYCYDTKLKDENHASRIAKHCINSGHGRNLEFADITLKITCSARCAREFYTHIGGAPTRVQASTRYITYDNFKYFTPSGLSDEQIKIINKAMDSIKEAYKELNAGPKKLGENIDLKFGEEKVVGVLCKPLEVVFETNLGQCEYKFD